MYTVNVQKVNRCKWNENNSKWTEITLIENLHYYLQLMEKHLIPNRMVGILCFIQLCLSN